MKYLKLFGKGLLWLVGSTVVAYTILVIVVRPSNERNWATDQAILPYAEITGDKVSVHNIRNFSYQSVSEYTPNYYNATFDMSKLKNVYFIVEPFSGFPGSAHTFLSFEFEGDKFVAISVEIRKEKGESFSPVKGLFRRYEITYVVGDERDLVKLRSNYRKDLVYVYPVKTTPEKMRSVFLDIIARVNELKAKPQFYNTVTNNCTTNIVSHVNQISPRRVPWDITLLLSENADRYAYDLGLIDNTLSFEETRKTHLINDRALEYADSPDFSLKIRGR